MDTKVLVREVLEDQAPEELFLLDTYSPDAKSAGAASRGPLGFGVESATALLLPVLYMIFESFLKDIGKHASTELVQLLKRLASKNLSDADSDAGLAKAKSLIVEEFTKAGVDADRSVQAAEKVVGVLIAHAK